MIEISKITFQEKDKNRCNLFVDGEFFLALSLETVIKYHLKAGSVLSSLELENIKMEEEKAFALKRAKDYILKNLKSKKQIKTYLKDKGFSYIAVNFAIEKLEEYNLIDDVEYARQYIKCRSEKEGKRLSDYKLMAKGINKKDIEKAREDCEDNGIKSACAILEKRLKNKEITNDILSKEYRYLLGKGFLYEEVDRAISIFKEKLD